MVSLEILFKAALYAVLFGAALGFMLWKAVCRIVDGGSHY